MQRLFGGRRPRVEEGRRYAGTGQLTMGGQARNLWTAGGKRAKRPTVGRCLHIGVSSYDISLEKQEVLVKGTIEYDALREKIAKTGKEVRAALLSFGDNWVGLLGTEFRSSPGRPLCERTGILVWEKTSWQRNDRNRDAVYCGGR